ncbi:pentatricopeptide repeat-containing protein At3g09040, mitochondrial-like [Triticum dicoccoides]|uniref:pentatricopeptide repeat-containing protein At3g09040, mitochondrial-like n=1 Tax=Triticum dicoccoides TaxID=85692 RepID=UPI000E78FA87|nr:pentatricopeptide repeat-containing protein At3g09040, mitochondrial-like [Triticum dicoccoides]
MRASVLLLQARGSSSTFFPGPKSPDPLALVHALSAASRSSRSPSRLHAQVLKLGMSGDTFTTNHLLISYSRSGLLGSALAVFDEMPHRNLVSWTAMVSASTRGGAAELGIGLFVSMLRSGFFPNEFSLASALRAACDRSAARAKLQFGALLHGVAVKVGVDADPFLGSSLLLMYARHGCVAAAERAFADVRCKDLTCWNAMLEGYVSNGCGYGAMRAMALMQQCGLPADMFTYVSALKACSITGELDFGRRLHGCVIHNMFESDTSVMNALVDMYLRSGLTDIAMAAFGRIRQKDTISWNTLISRFAHDEDDRAAACCFADMPLSGSKPNEVTFSIMLRLSGAKENASLGLQIFSLSYRHGYSDDVLVANAVINMLSRCGLLNCAHGFFCNLKFRNIVTWNEMIAGYGLYSCSEDAMRLFRSMVCFGERPDEFTYSAILSAFQESHEARNHEQLHAIILKQGVASRQFVSTSLIKTKAVFGSVQGALKVIEDTGEMDFVSWGVIITSFLKHGLNNEVLFLFNLFRSDRMNKPDEFILATVLNACANAALIRQSRCIHSIVVRTGHWKHFCVASALVDAYAKCGDISAAESAFATISSVSADAILYNTMLTAYANHGRINEALSLYQDMAQAQLIPTPATFVAIVSACSHFGLVEEGKVVFNLMMSEGQGMNPTRANFATLVDLLARKGLLREAKGVIEVMPFQPWPAVWRSLMNGCRIHGNKELGVLAAEQIMRMTPSSDGAYVSLSNVFADVGEWHSAEEARMVMAENQVWKVQGYSRIEV